MRIVKNVSRRSKQRSSDCFAPCSPFLASDLASLHCAIALPSHHPRHVPNATPSIMCAVTLTVVPACSHELPTIEYCANVEPEIQSYEAELKTGEQVQPPKTCTESLGGMLYEALNVRYQAKFDRFAADHWVQGPVTCVSCKAWLLKAGKRTFGGIAGAAPTTTAPDDTAQSDKDGEAEVGEQSEEKDDNDLTPLLQHVQKLRSRTRLPRD